MVILSFLQMQTCTHFQEIHLFLGDMLRVQKQSLQVMTCNGTTVYHSICEDGSWSQIFLSIGINDREFYHHLSKLTKQL